MDDRIPRTAHASIEEAAKRTAADMAMLEALSSPAGAGAGAGAGVVESSPSFLEAGH